MRQPEPGRIRRPRADDRLMRDVLFGISGYPAVLVAHDLKLLQYEAGRQYSGRELSSMLEEAGFSDLEVTPTFGYYSIVIGRKPG